jgi:GNAT superfamily N-acetyltransferase
MSRSLGLRDRIAAFFTLLRALAAGVVVGGFGVLARGARRRLYSNWRYYGLERDLDVPFAGPAAAVPIIVRRLRDGDVSKLLGMEDPRMSPRGPYVRIRRSTAILLGSSLLLNFLREGVGTCYVAATVDGDEPCYMQWLIPASENAAIRGYFGGRFPTLAKDEALLEYAFTPERFRGKGIMPAAMARIAEEAREFGARRVITFVDHENVPALKGCWRAGFREYVVRIDKWRLFHPSFKFAEIPPDDPARRDRDLR